MYQKEELLQILNEIMAGYGQMLEEYSTRISSYESALESVAEYLNDQESGGEAEDLEGPDSLMTDFLMEQESLEDLLPERFTREGLQDNDAVRTALDTLQRLQNMNDSLQDSMGNTAFSGLRDAYIMCREILETALTEAKADYMTLLENIDRLDAARTIVELENSIG